MALFNKTTAPAKKTPAAEKKETMKDLYKDEPVQDEKKTEKKTSVKISQAYRVLLRPLISEKATHAQALNQYFFAVAPNTNRIEVAKAIKEVYGIAPIKVNIIKLEGKVRNFGRIAGKRKDWKKAMVTLPKGKTISLYEGV